MSSPEGTRAQARQLVACPAAPPRARRAYVYAGPGTSPACVAALLGQLRRLSAAFALHVRTIDARALQGGHALRGTDLLCMPGGRDLPYLRQLEGRPAAALRAFVAAGGRYFGSCAGAYFASRELHFVAPRVPAVHGRRPLGFFAGQALGPSQNADTFAYAPGAGAAALQVSQGLGPPLPVYNRGGCVFAPLAAKPWPQAARVLARAGTRSVAVLISVGRGRALLWGAHPELNGSGLARAPTHAQQQAPAARLVRRHLAALLRL